MLGDSHQNWTSERHAQERINTIESKLRGKGIIDLAEKVCNRSVRILEVGTGYGTFLHTIKKMGFENIRGVDMEPAHYHRYPELDSIIDIETLGMLQAPSQPFDLVISHLIFDQSLYLDQRNNGFREYMLRGIYSQLKNNGVYCAIESHQKAEIRDTITAIGVTQDTFLGRFGEEFIAGNKK